MATCDQTFDWVEEFGVLIAAAIGLDTTWMDRGNCRNWDYGDGDETHRPTPWHVSSTSVVTVAGSPVRGSELTKMALIYCYRCPAQWDCARHAIRGMMQAGTWAMRITHLRGLQAAMTTDEAVTLIDAAEVAGEPVQVAVRNSRAVDAGAEPV